MAEKLQYQSHNESQKERWVKYGANVALMSVVVIVLAGLVIYLAQRTNRRIDTTASGAYSLKPQTLNIINDVKGKTKIVSLYQRATPQGGDKIDYAQPVMDLLDEYRRKGKNIEVDSIDPVANSSKVDDLITEVTNRYGGEVKQYRAVLEAYPKVYEQIQTIAAAEVQKIATLPLDKLGEADDSQMARVAVGTIRTFPKQLESSRDAIERHRSEKPPDYKGATTNVEDTADDFSRISDKVLEIFNKSKDDTKIPDPIRKYMADATPVYQQIKKLADDLLQQTKELGDLKLDDLRQSLRARDAILVMGENDMRVIPFEQVWKADDQQLRQYVPGQELKPSFAGEQQISTAILALSQASKRKVCFVRAGGPPVAQPGMGPFARGGPMSQVADRLRQYNFEVLEKDLSGMWAMQQMQMQQMPAAPEPTDEQLKDAIWIVLAFPTGQQHPGMPPPTIAPRVSDHLNTGGSAMLIFAPQVDNMSDTLKDWGIEVRSDAVAVHEPIKASEGRQVDAVEDAQRYAFVFDIRHYGDHLITRPLESLSSWLVPALSVKTAAQPPAGVKVTPIIPLPTEPRSWGETDIEALQNQAPIQFDEGKDVAGPIYAGAVAEKENGGRLVVIASPMFAFDRYVNDPDATMLRRGLIVRRFPANEELFNNSVFWLAKMEPMIAISPAAMEVARIEPISAGSLRFWRIGVLLIGLPAAVVIAGALVYVARKD